MAVAFESRQKPPYLDIGDRCWLLLGTLLYVVDIIDVRHIFEGEPDEFRTYRVSRRGAGGIIGETFIEGDTHHRTDLFKCPSERQVLFERLRDDVARLTAYRDQMEDEAEDETHELGLV